MRIIISRCLVQLVAIVVILALLVFGEFKEYERFRIMQCDYFQHIRAFTIWYDIAKKYSYLKNKYKSADHIKTYEKMLWTTVLKILRCADIISISAYFVSLAEDGNHSSILYIVAGQHLFSQGWVKFWLASYSGNVMWMDVHDTYVVKQSAYRGMLGYCILWFMAGLGLVQKALLYVEN